MSPGSGGDRGPILSSLCLLSGRHGRGGKWGAKGETKVHAEAWCFSWAPDLALRLLPACCSLGGRPRCPLEAHRQSGGSLLPSQSHTWSWREPSGRGWPIWPLIARGCVWGCTRAAHRRPPLLVVQDVQVATGPAVSQQSPPCVPAAGSGPGGAGPPARLLRGGHVRAAAAEPRLRLPRARLRRGDLPEEGGSRSSGARRGGAPGLRGG